MQLNLHILYIVDIKVNDIIAVNLKVPYTFFDTNGTVFFTLYLQIIYFFPAFAA